MSRALSDRRGKATWRLAAYDPYMHKWLAQTQQLMQYYRRGEHTLVHSLDRKRRIVERVVYEQIW